MKFFTPYLAYILAQKPCIPKHYRGTDNPMTCVCNSTYCDEVPALGTLGSNQAAVYTSSQSGKRMERTTMNFKISGSKELGGITIGSLDTNKITIKVNENVKNQTIFGFGGAFTDASGINMKRLSKGARDNLINTYFGPGGKPNK